MTPLYGMRRKAKSWNSTLRPITQKTADRNQLWKHICLWRAGYLVAKYGKLICEYCGKAGSIDRESFLGIWGHHITGDRNDTSLENCFLCHTATCHDKITRENLQVTQEGFEGG